MTRLTPPAIKDLFVRTALTALATSPYAAQTNDYRNPKNNQQCFHLISVLDDTGKMTECFYHTHIPSDQ